MTYDRDVWTYDDAYDDAQSYLAENFCEDCGGCLLNINACCCILHHCQQCEACIDEPACFGCMEEFHDGSMCESCLSSLKGDDRLVGHCFYCGEHFGYDTGEKCSCDVGWQHCVDCIEMACKECGVCLVIDGENTDLLDGGCEEHELCNQCIYDDPEHCTDCGTCASTPCDECGLCEDCISSHCPECEHCFGYGADIQWCMSDGEHCYLCCEENDWLCEKCGVCTEGAGTELCPDCGLCEECCKENTEDAGCTHDYCIESGDYEGHLCPECQTCPEDTECEYCGLCEDCQADYHCEHDLCVDNPDWDEHLCQDCGECFDPDELCEYCGKCESCAGDYHCEHGYCPDGGDWDDGDHFVCDQCGECFEGLDRCDYCELCTTCCESNTQDMGCQHDICIESPDFAEHWCYEDDQCLEKCAHDADCAHQNVSSTWNHDGTAHWHVCSDCGAAVDKAIHTEGAPVTITEPDASKHRNGTASLSCSVCNTGMGTVSIPYVPIPEDGSPYIITQPKDYEGKTSTVDWRYGPSESVNRYATFTVRAGGKELTYQWYEQLGTGTAKAITDDNFYLQGGTTASLKVLVYSDACINPDYQKYYCVVTNTSGSAQTRTAGIRAEHSFGHYADNGDGTHSYVCNGECYVAQSTRAHRLGEWELIRPATDTQTGLLRQECMDCGAKSEQVIPKVEPGHQHAYNQARSNATEHWFVCKCGVPSPNPAQSHSFGTPLVILEPTTTRKGEQQLTCTVCSFTKVETLDKLPHTHEYWGWSYKGTDYSKPDPEKCGRNKDCHYFFCKSGDKAMLKEAHDLSTFVWHISEAATPTSKGIIRRYCETCQYEERKTYDYGTYPVLIQGGTSSHEFAAPGTTVTVTYTKIPDLKWGSQTFWKDLSTSSLYSGEGFKSVTLSPRAGASTVTFTMPNGPVGLAVYNSETCKHTSGTYLGEVVQPTCRAYGHQPDALCLDCDAVVTPGARIEALGHDVDVNSPIISTAKKVYCTHQYSYYGTVHEDETTHATGYGYAGDLWCNRCNQIVKGRKAPIVHQCLTTDHTLAGNSSSTASERTKYSNTRIAPTCTKDGMDNDTICVYCNAVVGKARKIPRLGHEWSEWTTVREATTTSKGREQRVCLHDESHVESRVTDYSGPDYRLKADKLRLSFEWTYGETPKSQTVAFTSIGRDNVTGLRSIVGTLGPKRVDVAFRGMVMTITPRVDEVLEDQSQKVVRLSSVTYRNTTIGFGEFTAPAITVTFKIKKAPVAFSLADDTKTMYAGETEQAPVLSGKPDDVTATWRSSDYSVATVDPVTGEVTARAPGVAVITASYAGDDYHTSSKASYTLIVRGSKMPGDVNNDGTIDISDVTALTNIVLGRDNNEPHVFNHAAADVDDDGSVTNFDVRTLANNILGNNAFMYVEDVFTLTGRTVATGTILRGLFRTGQPIVLRSINDAIPDAYLTINSIEMFRKVVPEAVAGDGVGIVLNVDRDKIGRGDVLTIANNPNVIHSKTVKGTLYLYTKAEGGRHTPITSNYTPDLLIGGVTFSVQFSNLGTIDGATPTMIMPGQTSENIVLEVQDAERTPYAFKGQVVYLRESGRTIGKLTITGQ